MTSLLKFCGNCHRVWFGEEWCQSEWCRKAGVGQETKLTDVPLTALVGPLVTAIKKSPVSVTNGEDSDRWPKYETVVSHSDLMANLEKVLEGFP